MYKKESTIVRAEKTKPTIGTKMEDKLEFTIEKNRNLFLFLSNIVYYSQTMLERKIAHLEVYKVFSI